MKLQTTTISGKAGKEIESAIFDRAGSTTLVAQAVRVYLANQRAGTAKTKTRGEVNLTKKKWYKQKHTGNARHGAQSAPIFVGGGVAHGQNGTSNWKLTMSQTMRTRALETALAMQATKANVLVVSGFDAIKGKTREMVAALRSLEATDKAVLLVVDIPKTELDRATANIENIFVCQAKDLNTYVVTRAQKILITPEGLESLEKRLENKEKFKVQNSKIEPEPKTVKSRTKKTTVKKVVKS